MVSLTIGVIVHEDSLGLRRLLRSLERSFKRGPRFAILVIDNNSKYDPVPMGLRSEFPKLDIEIHNRTKNSLSEARQQALELATTEWLAFIDADCRVLPNWGLEASQQIEQISALNGSDVAAWGAPAVNRGTSLEARINRYLGQAFHGHHQISKPKEVFHLPTSHLFVHRARALTAGGFTSNFHRAGEDMLFSYRLHHASFKTLLLPKPVIFHAQKPGLMRFLKRLERYGGVHGSLAWHHPRHLLGRRLIPLAALIILSALLVIKPALGAGFLGLSLILWLWRGPISGGAGKNLSAWLLMGIGFFFYGIGTIRGLATRKS